MFFSCFRVAKFRCEMLRILLRLVPSGEFGLLQIWKIRFKILITFDPPIEPAKWGRESGEWNHARREYLWWPTRRVQWWGWGYPLPKMGWKGSCWHKSSGLMEWVYESICYEILLRSGDEREPIWACSGLAIVGILYSPPQPWKQPNESTCIDYGLHLRMRKPPGNISLLMKCHQMVCPDLRNSPVDLWRT